MISWCSGLSEVFTPELIMLSQQERCIHHQTSPSVVWCAGAIQFWMVFCGTEGHFQYQLTRILQMLPTTRSRWWFQPFVTIMSLMHFCFHIPGIFPR